MLVHRGREPEPRDQIAMKVVRDQIGKRVNTLHRLDRPTSGILLFGLDPAIEKEMRRQFTEQEVGKFYTAVVPGVTPSSWTADAPLRKEEGELFRDCRTDFQLQRRVRIQESMFSILSARPRTGRYHQIRKHLSGSGHPIVGDYLYGTVAEMERIESLTGEARLMLHAGEMRFLHPVTQSEVRITSPLPDRFAPFLEAETVATQ